MAQKTTLFKNTIYKTLLSIANILIPLIISPFILRLLDVELYGTYNKVFAEFQIFLTFASLGIYTFGVREISKIRNDKKKVSILFTNLFVISLISNLIVTAIYIIYSFFTSDGITLALYMTMLIQFVGNMFYIEFVNEALENYKFITIKTVLIKVLYMIAIFLLLKNPDDIIIYSIIVSMTVFLNNIVSYIYAKRKIKFDFKELKIRKYIKSLLIIMVVTNVGLLYSQLDKVMLGKFVSDISVTYYYIPYYLIGTLASIPYSLINVSIPRLSYVLENEGSEAYQSSLTSIISALIFIIAPMCLGVCVLSYEVIYLYAGIKYVVIASILALACIARLFVSIESIFINLIMYPHGKENIIMKYSLICGIINLGFNILLVVFDILTPFTAMFTTMIAELILTYIIYLYIKKQLHFVPKIITKSNLLYMGLSLCFIPIALLVKSFNLGLILNIGLIVIGCSLFYIIVLMIVKDPNYLMVKNKIFRKLKKV